jgi:outer membrane protein
MSGSSMKLYLLFCIAYFPFSISVATAGNFPYLLDDPLHVRPPILESNALLPENMLPALCHQDVDFTKVLQLRQVVDLALCNNPEIKIAWATIKAQSSQLGEAKASYFPTITGTVNELRTKTKYPDLHSSPSNIEKGQTFYGSLSWRIFDFGAREANNNIAELLLASALAEHSATTQKILTNTSHAYFEAISAKGAFFAREKALEITRATLTSTRNKEARGAAPMSDVLQANTAYAKAKLAAQRAEGVFHKTIIVLRQVMGVSSSTQFLLPQTVNALALTDLGSLQDWLTDVEQSHPSIMAARNNLAAAKSKEQAIRTEGLPTLDLTGNYYKNGYPNQGLSSTRTNVTTIGLTLTIPIFDGFSSTYKLRGAQAQSERAEAELQETEQRIMAEVAKAHADAIASLANVESSEILLESARDALSVSERRYNKGAADILELLTTQSMLVDAEQERILCLTQWNSALLKLAGSAGKLNTEKIAHY